MNRFPKSSFLALCALAVLLPVTAQAHKAWLLPSATVLSDHSWVTFDAAVSNDLFYFNHVPLRLDGLAITAPDGNKVTPVNSNTLKYRNVFDLEVKQDGTYRIAVVNDGLNASYLNAAGEKKRWRGNAAAMATEIPKNATQVEVTQSSARVETFVTSGKPTTTALAPTGSGLEMIPQTHPNDLFAGETATWRFTMDGKPASNLDVEVIPGGSRYRDQQNEMRLKTDAEGLLKITWPAAGMYWLEASVDGAKPSVKAASKRRATYVATLEVLAP
ncbi:MAG: DUF4198 domain-containing protein [Dokdonella sp.]